MLKALLVVVQPDQRRDRTVRQCAARFESTRLREPARASVRRGQTAFERHACPRDLYTSARGRRHSWPAPKTRHLGQHPAVVPPRRRREPIAEQLDLLLGQALVVPELPKPLTAPQGGIRRDENGVLDLVRARLRLGVGHQRECGSLQADGTTHSGRRRAGKSLGSRSPPSTPCHARAAEPHKTAEQRRRWRRSST